MGIKTKIRPSDINVGGLFAPLFGFDRANVSANTLVRLAQQNGSWRNFDIDEADRLSETHFVFNGLTSGRSPLIIPRKDGTYAFTIEFIERCVASAPKRPVPGAPPPVFSRFGVRRRPSPAPGTS
jgi:hypothetical protein